MKKLGFVSPIEVLFWNMASYNNEFYFHGKWGCTKTHHPFVLFALCRGFVETYIATPATVKPIYVRAPETYSYPLLNLCRDVVAAYYPDVGEQFSRFLDEVSDTKTEDDQE